MPRGCPAEAGSIWAEPSLDAARQMRTLELIFRLMLTYGATWQSMEWPSRAFDSERCLVSGCMLAVFDAVLRRTVIHVAAAIPIAISAYPATDAQCDGCPRC